MHSMNLKHVLNVKFKILKTSMIHRKRQNGTHEMITKRGIRQLMYHEANLEKGELIQAKIKLVYVV